ncbi:unnamed protein product [Rotaria sp. Silwood1]|nr:unnamed protein product [Rotaria sp. Silwood1]
MSSNVHRDGFVVLPYLRSWHYPISNLFTLLQLLSESFSESPPVFSRISPGYVSLTNSSRASSTSNASSSTTYGQTSNKISNNVDEQRHTHRFSALATEPRQMLLPIQGFEKMPLGSLEEAINPIVSFVPDVEQMVWFDKQNCSDPKDGLTNDESASIMLYTMEWEPYEKSFYKLPSTRHVVYRGIKSNLTAQYVRGSRLVWWGFSSCTLSIETLKNERFLGNKGVRTLFSIDCQSAKNIRSHSFYAEEDEILLLPARQFEVIGCLDPGNGLHIIQWRETQPKFPLIKLN